MDYFDYKDKTLYCEDVDLNEISKKFGTPCYVYSKKTIERHVKVYKDSFTKKNLICFAVKSLSNIAILDIINRKGCGFDIVSGGELYRVLKIGADPKKIVFSGVGKSSIEIANGIKEGILSFNVESNSELKRIEEIAENLNITASVSLRFNPDINSGGHEYISTGKKGDKFGIPSIEETISLCEYIENSKMLQLKGVACHIGSQILNIESFKMIAERTLELIERLEKLGINLGFVDLGGGLGVTYDKEVAPQPSEIINAIEEIFKNRDEMIVLEPGRSISANAGMLLTKVEYIKDKFLIVDAGMNDLMRPALYKAHHKIININLGDQKNKAKWDIVGPVCESSDCFARDILLSVKQHDLIGIMGAGAYGHVMASNYNSRPRPPEVLVDGKNFYLIRKRESISDIVNHEIIHEN